MSSIANTPEPPYYAVIFTSFRTEGDHGYDEMAKKCLSLHRSSLDSWALSQLAKTWE